MRHRRLLTYLLGVLATCMILAAPAPAATTQFDFTSDLTATFGPGTLSYLNDTASKVTFGKASTYGAAAMADGDPDVMYFQAFSGPTTMADLTGAQALIFDTASPASPDWNRINQWTLILDLLVPAIDTTWMGVIECQPDQRDTPTSPLRGDDECFVKRTITSPATAGVGTMGQYAGTILANEWHRIAITSDMLKDLDIQPDWPWLTEVRTYIDGAQVGGAIVVGTLDNVSGGPGHGGPDMRWSLGCGAGTPGGEYGCNELPFLFYDRDNETNDGIVSSMYFTDRVMSAAEIAALGGPTVAGIVVPGPGDANADGVVDSKDASILGAHWLVGSDATWGMGDFNGDYKVDDKDAAILAAHWTGTPAESVPEPGALVLLVSAAAALWFWRRR